MFLRHLHANDAKTFLKHFSDCLFYFCFTCVDSISVISRYTYKVTNTCLLSVHMLYKL